MLLRSCIVGPRVRNCFRVGDCGALVAHLPWAHTIRLQQLRPFLLATNISNKSGNLLFAQNHSNRLVHLSGGGLLIHPDLFASTHFRLFC